MAGRNERIMISMDQIKFHIVIIYYYFDLTEPLLTIRLQSDKILRKKKKIPKIEQQRMLLNLIRRQNYIKDNINRSEG